jgi:hypothetical protein
MSIRCRVTNRALGGTSQRIARHAMYPIFQQSDQPSLAAYSDSRFVFPHASGVSDSHLGSWSKRPLRCVIIHKPHTICPLPSVTLAVETANFGRFRNRDPASPPPTNQDQRPWYAPCCSWESQISAYYRTAGNHLFVPHMRAGIQSTYQSCLIVDAASETSCLNNHS